MGSELTARDVLDGLDYDASENAAFFLDFDHGYYYHVDQRMTLFADRSRWVLAIEHLGVNPRAGGAMTNVYYHGNAICLPPQPGWKGCDVQSIRVLEDGPGEPLLAENDGETVNLSAKHASIRGQVVPIRTDANYYWARAIDVDILKHEQIDEWIDQVQKTYMAEELKRRAIENYEGLRGRVGKYELRLWHLLRGMVPEYRDLLMAAPEELRRGVPKDLPQLLQIDEWDHPHLIEGERPSSCESFKLIAKIAATGEASLWRPVEEPNTHWKHWPHSGSM